MPIDFNVSTSIIYWILSDSNSSRKGIFNLHTLHFKSRILRAALFKKKWKYHVKHIHAFDANAYRVWNENAEREQNKGKDRKPVRGTKAVTDRQKQGREARFRDGMKKRLQNSEERSRRTMGRGTASSGRCRPQTLQRFLSLGFNSMLPACHSDLRSVPVIRTAFRAGPKQQSCLRGGRWRGAGAVVVEWGGGAHEPMRFTFKLTRGRYIFTFSLALPRLIGEGDGGKREFCLSGFFI